MPDRRAFLIFLAGTFAWGFGDIAYVHRGEDFWGILWHLLYFGAAPAS